MKTNPPAKPSPAVTLGDTLTGVARAWERFWFRPANPTTLCVMRVGAGLVSLYILFSYSFDLLALVGPHAWLDQASTDFIRHRFVSYTLPNDWEGTPQEVRGTMFWSIFYHVRDPHWIWAIHAAAFGVALLFTIGLWTRVTSVLMFLVALSYCQRAFTTTFGMDTMWVIALLYLMIGPSGACLSADRLLEVWRAKRRGLPVPPVSPSVSANFATRLCQVHFCFIYLSSGASKLMGQSWWAGTALWRTFLNYEFAPMDNPAFMAVLTFLAKHRLLWELFMSGGVLFTLWTELGLPFLIWLPKMRWVMLICSVLLHTGIGLFMGLVMFSALMVVLVFSFAPPEQVEYVLNGLYAALPRWLGLARAGTAEQRRPVPGVSGA